jgi:hypothetical protein
VLPAPSVTAAPMSTEAKHIPRIQDHAERKRARAEFDSSMVMIRYHVGEADKESAEYYFQQLMAQCRFLSRRFGFRIVEK